LLVEALAGQPAALPHREVRVLDRQVRQVRLAAAGVGTVEGAELAAEHAHRPAVRDDVV
jgi:hypothetical protein